jgi:hypothetical protein
VLTRHDLKASKSKGDLAMMKVLAVRVIIGIGARHKPDAAARI